MLNFGTGFSLRSFLLGAVATACLHGFYLHTVTIAGDPKYSYSGYPKPIQHYETEDIKVKKEMVRLMQIMVGELAPKIRPDVPNEE